MRDDGCVILCLAHERSFEISTNMPVNLYWLIDFILR